MTHIMRDGESSTDIDKIKNKDFGRTFDRSTDSLEALREAVDAGMVVLQANTRAQIAFPSEVEIPESGTTNYQLYLYLFNTAGEMEAPDSAPTIAINDAAGNVEVAETPMTLVDTGRYYYTVAIANTETPESWIAQIKVIEGGNTRYYGANFDLVHDSVGTRNDTTTDTIHGKIGTDTEMADSSLFDILTAVGADNNDNTFASTNVVSNRDGSLLERTEYIMDDVENIVHGVGDVIIYPVAEDISTTELSDDGSSPLLTAQVQQANKTEAEGIATPAWTEDINFEQNGTVTLLSIYFGLYWQQQFTVGAGAGTTTYAKWQISGDGGSTWVDVTDNVSETAAAYNDKIRIGVSLPITAITAGANQLQLRLCAWTDDAGGTSTVETKVRSNSYLRISYRKS